jgi:hypothetical protein
VFAVEITLIQFIRKGKYAEDEENAEPDKSIKTAFKNVEYQAEQKRQHTDVCYYQIDGSSDMS